MTARECPRCRGTREVGVLVRADERDEGRSDGKDHATKRGSHTQVAELIQGDGGVVTLSLERCRHDQAHAPTDVVGGDHRDERVVLGPDVEVA